MSSEDGGVGTTSFSVRRSRPSRAGALRVGSGLVCTVGLVRAFGFTRLTLRLFATVFRVFWAAPRFAAGCLRLGRLAERAVRPVFFACLGVTLRPPLFRLAITSVPSEP